jgi:hypothetical protein
MTNRSAKDVLDHYYAEFYRPEVKLLSEQIRQLPEFKKHPEAIALFDEANVGLNRKVSRIVRRDGDGYGVMAYLDMGRKDFYDAYLAGAKDFVRTGNLDVLGVGKAIVALEDGPGQTTVLTFWTGPGFDIRRFLRPPGQDAEGDDIPDVPRPPDSVRVLSTLEKDPLARVRVATYKVGTTPLRTMFFYLSALPEAGWRKHPLFEKADTEAGHNNTLFFVQKDRELTVSLQPSGAEETTIIAIERAFRG